MPDNGSINWRLVREGDRIEIEKATEKYKRLAYKIAHKWVKTSDIAQDEAISLANEALVKCLVDSGFSPEFGDFTSYLATSVENEFRMWYRSATGSDEHNKEAKSLEGTEVGEGLYLKDVFEDDYFCPDKALQDRIGVRKLGTVLLCSLERMGDLERFCFVFYLMGVSQVRIAEMVGFSQGYISQVMKRSVEKVRRQYEEETNC